MLWSSQTGIKRLSSRERNDSPGPVYGQPVVDFRSYLLCRIAILGIVQHCLNRNARALDDQLPGNLARNMFNVGAVGPVNVFHVSLRGGGRGFL